MSLITCDLSLDEPLEDDFFKKISFFSAAGGAVRDAGETLSLVPATVCFYG